LRGAFFFSLLIVPVASRGAEIESPFTASSFLPKQPHLQSLGMLVVADAEPPASRQLESIQLLPDNLRIPRSYVNERVPIIDEESVAKDTIGETGLKPHKIGKVIWLCRIAGNGYWRSVW
jgi:hypothetical protein